MAKDSSVTISTYTDNKGSKESGHSSIMGAVASNQPAKFVDGGK